MCTGLCVSSSQGDRREHLLALNFTPGEPVTHQWSMQYTFQTPASTSFSEKKDDSKTPSRIRPRLHVRDHCVPEQENNLENPLDQLYLLSVWFVGNKGA